MTEGKISLVSLILEAGQHDLITDPCYSSLQYLSLDCSFPLGVLQASRRRGRRPSTAGQCQAVNQAVGAPATVSSGVLGTLCPLPSHCTRSLCFFICAGGGSSTWNSPSHSLAARDLLLNAHSSFTTQARRRLPLLIPIPTPLRSWIFHDLLS